MLPASSRRRSLAALFLLLAPGVLLAQEPDPVADSSLLTLSRINSSREFAGQSFGPARWIEDGKAYTTLERADTGNGRDIVRYDTGRGSREVLVSGSVLMPPGDTAARPDPSSAWRLTGDTVGAPAFADPATDDYRILGSDRGVTWRPADRRYGP